MRKLVAYRPLFFFLVVLLCLPLAALAYSNVRIVRLTWVEGSVWVTRPERPQPVRAVEHLPLEHAAVIETVAGVAEIEFEDRTFVRLASGSRLRLAELGLEENGDRVTHLSLEEGTATFEVRPRRGDSTIVLAPQLTISFPEKATVRVDIAPSANRVRVFRGRAVVETRADTLTLHADQMLEWMADSGQYRIARNAPADAWDRWNDDRAGTVQTVASYTAPSVTGGGTVTGYSSYWGGVGSRGYCGSWYYDPFFNSWMWTSYLHTRSYRHYGWYPYSGFGRAGCGMSGFWWSSGGLFFGYPGFWWRPTRVRVHRPVGPPDGDTDGGDGSTTARGRWRPRRPVDRDGPVLGFERSLRGSRRALTTSTGSSTRNGERVRRTSQNPVDSVRPVRRPDRQSRRVNNAHRHNRTGPSVRRAPPRSSGRQVRRPATTRRPTTSSRGRSVQRSSNRSSSSSRRN